MENGQLKADLNSTLQSQIPDDDDEVGIASKITAQYEIALKKVNSDSKWTTFAK